MKRFLVILAFVALFAVPVLARENPGGRASVTSGLSPIGIRVVLGTILSPLLRIGNPLPFQIL
jgi:hypothetical protein